MESISFPQFQGQNVAHIALFKDTTNSGELRKRIISAATLEGPKGDEEREAVNFAFVEANLITSRLHLQTAIHQALLAQAQNALRTKTVHSEILYYLNPTHNITEAIRRYGISDSSRNVILVRVASASEDRRSIEEQIKTLISGTQVGLDELGDATDWSAVKKYHKLNNEPALKAAAGDVQREHSIVDNIVTSSVAMKSVMQ